MDHRQRSIWHKLLIVIAALALQFVPILAEAGPGSELSVRGVAPELQSRYKSGNGKFACSSGGPSIPADRVNDNYCDCIDGSDEPGDFRFPASYQLQ